MVFSSVIFLLYFLPAFLLTYYLSPVRWKNAIALLGSACFYAWGEPVFFFLVLASLYLDYYLVRMMHYSDGKLKKNLLVAVVVINVLILVLFKYLMFLVMSIGGITASMGWHEMPSIYIALPIGISFITFQKISYAVDVYRNVRSPMEKMVDYGLYILFFPQLIAGPIIRFHEVTDQIRDRRAQENIDSKLLGFQRFIIGLAKKVLIANPLGVFANEAFAALPHGLGMGMAWLGIIAYSFQIYFDFSGYSDMAIGLARMMGFKFPENFQFPYISQSITEFWRRWHITLSKWMRDYLYIPLGGNRVTPRRLYINLWTVFLISGLWHGAAWNFVIWGAFHGAFLVMDRVFLVERLKNWPKIGRIALTYMIVLIGWVFFRAESLGDALWYIGKLFSFAANTSFVSPDAYTWFILLLAAVCSFMGGWKGIEERIQKGLTEAASVRVYALRSIAVILLGFWSLVELFGTGFNPFIYFRF